MLHATGAPSIEETSGPPARATVQDPERIKADARTRRIEISRGSAPRRRGRSQGSEDRVAHGPVGNPFTSGNRLPLATAGRLRGETGEVAWNEDVVAADEERPPAGAGGGRQSRLALRQEKDDVLQTGRVHRKAGGAAPIARPPVGGPD